MLVDTLGTVDYSLLMPGHRVYIGLYRETKLSAFSPELWQRFEQNRARSGFGRSPFKFVHMKCPVEHHPMLLRYIF